MNRIFNILSVLVLVLFISACSSGRLGGRGSLPCTDFWWDAQERLNVSICELTQDTGNNPYYDNYCRETCVKELAYKMENSKLCELINDFKDIPPVKGWPSPKETGSVKDRCYDHISIKTDDVSLCYRIQREQSKKICIERFSR